MHIAERNLATRILRLVYFDYAAAKLRSKLCGLCSARRFLPVCVRDGRSLWSKGPRRYSRSWDSRLHFSGHVLDYALLHTLQAVSRFSIRGEKGRVTN